MIVSGLELRHESVRRISVLLSSKIQPWLVKFVARYFHFQLICDNNLLLELFLSIVSLWRKTRPYVQNVVVHESYPCVFYFKNNPIFTHVTFLFCMGVGWRGVSIPGVVSLGGLCHEIWRSWESHADRSVNWNPSIYQLGFSLKVFSWLHAMSSYEKWMPSGHRYYKMYSLRWHWFWNASKPTSYYFQFPLKYIWCRISVLICPFIWDMCPVF